MRRDGVTGALAVLVACACAHRGATQGTRGAKPAANVAPSGTTVTVVDGRALVEARRKVTLAPGIAELRWDDLPAALDVRTLRVRVTTARGDAAVLERRLGQPRTPAAPGPATAPTIAPARRTSQPLALLVDGEGGGPAVIDLAYETPGVTWSADYAVLLGENDRAGAELAGWVTVTNRAGAPFDADALRLVAHVAAGVGANGEPHTYTLAPRAGGQLAADGSTAVPLFPPARGVPVERVLVFDPVGERGVNRGPDVARDPSFGFPVPGNDANGASGAVDEYLELPAPAHDLPPGRVRFFRRGESAAATHGALEWLGEATIPATAAGTHLRLRAGPSSDVVGHRRQTEFSDDDEGRRLVEEVEITLSNHAATPRRVVVLERLARGDTWRLFWYDRYDMTQEDDRTVRVEVTVPPGGEKKLVFRELYGWGP